VLQYGASLAVLVLVLVLVLPCGAAQATPHGVIHRTPLYFPALLIRLDNVSGMAPPGGWAPGRGGPQSRTSRQARGRLSAHGG
jgi:hypothetical protein